MRPWGRIATYTMTAILSLSFLLIMKHDSMYTSSFLSMITNAEQVRHYANLPKEYTPVWAVDVEKTITESNSEKVTALSGKAGLRTLEWEPERRAFAVKASSQTLVRIATFYYPGWEAMIDGKKSSIAIEEKSGAMLVDVPSGEHALKLTFGDTPLRVFSRYLSVCSFLLMAIFTMLSAKKAVKDQKERQHA
jgi:hypothetical protein